MLDRFKVPIEDQVRVPEDSLRETVTAVFEKMGESPEHAAAGADHLVAADLRGVESHGVSNMLRSYIEYYNEGKIRSDHRMRVVRESRGTAVLDADKGLAIILGPEAMQMAVDKARDVGVGIVTLINAGHSGAIGYHALHAAKQDMVGMCFHSRGHARRSHVRCGGQTRDESHGHGRPFAKRGSVPFRRGHILRRAQ